MQLGYNLLVLSAGVGALPEDVLEAARLDGASGLRLQRSIIMPLITPQLFFLVVVGTIHALQSFGQIQILTVGGPDGRPRRSCTRSTSRRSPTTTPTTATPRAQAMVLLLIVLAITALQFGVLERKVFYR